MYFPGHKGLNDEVPIKFFMYKESTAAFIYYFNFVAF